MRDNGVALYLCDNGLYLCDDDVTLTLCGNCVALYHWHYILNRHHTYLNLSISLYSYLILEFFVSSI